MAKRASTIGKGKPEASIRVFASGGLIGNIRRLSRMACAESLDEFDRTCLIVSAFLNAGAAIEATLMDYAARTNMPGYNRDFGSKSVWRNTKRSSRGEHWTQTFRTLFGCGMHEMRFPTTSLTTSGHGGSAQI
jgi:hypothetical protein